MRLAGQLARIAFHAVLFQSYLQTSSLRRATVLATMDSSLSEQADRCGHLLDGVSAQVQPLQLQHVAEAGGDSSDAVCLGEVCAMDMGRGDGRESVWLVGGFCLFFLLSLCCGMFLCSMLESLT